MEVTFYGVRGSIAVPGPSTARYGGNTVCVELVTMDGTRIILDAGTGLRELGKARLRSGYAGVHTVLLTHVHWDHILGLPFYGPLWRKETHVRIFPLANPEQQRVLERRALFDGIHFPVRAHDVPARIEFVGDDREVWQIGSARVRRVALNHPGGAQGFRVDDADGRSLAYLTDNELSPPGPVTTSLDTLARFASEVDLLIHDAQYVDADMPEKHGWGHSTIGDVLALARTARARRLALFHHDPERDDDALDALGVSTGAWLGQNSPGTALTIAREGDTLRF